MSVDQGRAPRDLNSAPPYISVTVTALNEEDNVRPQIAEIAAALDGLYDYEIVWVDDGSTDRSAQVVEELMCDPDGPAKDRLRLIKHTKSAGKSRGLMTCAKAAEGILLVHIDADLQNDAQDIPEMIKAFEAAGGIGKVGTVAGQRRRRRDTLLKRFSSRTANRVRRALLKDRTRDTGCGLKLIPRHLFIELPYFEGMHRYIPALIARTGQSIELVTVNDRPRVAGASKYGFWDRLWVGIGDMLMVWWMIRRYRKTGEVVEVDAK